MDRAQRELKKEAKFYEVEETMIGEIKDEKKLFSILISYQKTKNRTE
ncbi:MAG: hypothetical protein NT012_01240 [Candidatus Nealsonbacteria bacterium]|nr:hypothetical protein [Candidatus Nealsonbacteria bacterium]